ncbi:MAG: hypothetical protein DWQ40_00200 [Actinobacteria bacterium]|nr:MAG: hypothetical protein DWQ40_00200 [Actinomycetota bacterium]
MSKEDETPKSGRRARRALGWITVLLLVFAFVPVVGASEVAEDDEEFDIVVPVDTMVHAEAGSEIVLSTSDTPEEFIGATCTVSATSDNQSSVHPNNDLVIHGESNDVTLPDVEAVPGGTVTSTDTLELPSEIVITLIMGPDETFSAGLEVGFDCPAVSPTSTSTSTTIAPTSTSIETTTTSTEVGSTQVTTTTQPGEVGGTEVTSTTLATEVLGTEVLPFTGPEDLDVGLIGLLLVGLGGLLLIGIRSLTVSPTSVSESDG